MEKNKLLKSLFPDSNVRNVIKKVIKNSSAHGEPMSTNYSFLNAAKDTVFTSSGQACFGSLSMYWTEYSKKTGDKAKAVYLAYKPNYSVVCNKATRIRWIELGQEMGILDDDVSATHINTNGIVIDMSDEGLTIGELYLKLTYLRWTREAASLVNNVVMLVDEAGRDFWAAVTYCHDNNVARVDHSLLPFKASYPTGGNKANINRDLGLIMRMHKITAMPRVTDKRTVVKSIKKGTGLYWQWQSVTVKPEKTMVVADRLMLLSSELHPLIYSGDVNQAFEMIKELKKANSNVKFEK